MTEEEIIKRIYPSIVTYLGDWRQMVKDVGRFKLKEVSLFLTGASFSERQQIYQALKDSEVKRIPHVHLRHDMQERELNFLVSHYHTKIFTAHYQHLKRYKNFGHKKKIFIECNNGQARIKNFNTLKSVGGVCIDLAHLEYFRLLLPHYYEITCQAAKNYRVGCNHLSAVLPNGLSYHRAYKFSDLDYVKNISQKYFSRYICLELINSIEEQLEFKKYIAKLLARSWQK